MSALTLDQRVLASSAQTQRQIHQFLDAPELQQQEVATILAEIKQGTPRGHFLEKLIRVGLAASEPISVWPNFDEHSDFSAVLEVLSQQAVLAGLSTTDPLAIHRLKGMSTKQELLHFQGTSPLKSEQVAEMLMISREAVNKRRKNQQLIACRLGRRGYLYPAWQFQEETVIPGLKDILEALNAIGEWTPLLFFCSGDPRLNGETPLDCLKAGEIDAVIAAARAYGQPNPA